MADLAGMCRREVLLTSFGENSDTDTDKDTDNCCDVCKMEIQLQDMSEELKIVVDAINNIGAKGEVKLVQWIRGSSVAWTSSYNRKLMSYGNFKGKSEMWWRKFIRQCHVAGYVDKQLKSIIKKSGHYSIQGVYHVLTKANKDLASEDSRILLYKAPEGEITSQNTSTKKSRCNNSEPGKAQSSRVGKGTHGLVVVRNLLTDKETWIVPNTESEWQYPGKFSDKESNKHEQCVIFVQDYRSVYPTCPKNLDFLWSDIQLSKGKVNNYKTSVTIDGKEVPITYRSAPCNGVKVCPESGRCHVVPIRELRPCKDHPSKPLHKTNDTEKCPVQFGYICPEDAQDHRRWILGFVRQPKGPSKNLHNHPIHSSSHPLTKTMEDIHNAATSNTALKPSDVSKGKGLGYIPAAVDRACANLDRISRVMKKARNDTIACSMDWDAASFEEVADEIDAKDKEHGSTFSQPASVKLGKLSRPYLISAGIDNGIRYIFTMNPLMSEVLSKAEFIEADITFNETKEYPYLFNVVAFNDTTMEWTVVSRVRMNKQNHEAYCLGFI